MIIFTNTSEDFVLISADFKYIENDHNFDRTEDRPTVFLKWTDFSFSIQKCRRSQNCCKNRSLRETRILIEIANFFPFCFEFNAIPTK